MAEAAIAGARLILDDIQGFLKDKAITDYGANKFITVNAEVRVQARGEE